MAALTIHSGLTGFRLVHCISHVSGHEVLGQTCFDNAPPFAGLEAMAQLGALDVRRRIDFAAHAFLLKIMRCDWRQDRALNGVFHLRANPGGHSQRAYTYRTRALGPAGLTIQADLMFGVVDYGADFQERHLHHYYQELFTCLCNATRAR